MLTIRGNPLFRLILPGKGGGASPPKEAPGADWWKCRLCGKPNAPGEGACGVCGRKKFHKVGKKYSAIVNAHKKEALQAAAARQKFIKETQRVLTGVRNNIAPV